MQVLEEVEAAAAAVEPRGVAHRILVLVLLGQEMQGLRREECQSFNRPDTPDDPLRDILNDPHRLVLPSSREPSRIEPMKD